MLFLMLNVHIQRMCIGWSSQVSMGHSSFHLEDGTNLPYCALQFLPFINKGENRLCIFIVFVLKKKSHVIIKSTSNKPLFDY